MVIRPIPAGHAVASVVSQCVRFFVWRSGVLYYLPVVRNIQGFRRSYGMALRAVQMQTSLLQSCRSTASAWGIQGVTLKTPA